LTARDAAFRAAVEEPGSLSTWTKDFSGVSRITAAGDNVVMSQKCTGNVTFSKVNCEGSRYRGAQRLHLSVDDTTGVEVRLATVIGTVAGMAANDA
jgi:hypothetical protein